MRLTAPLNRLALEIILARRTKLAPERLSATLTLTGRAPEAPVAAKAKAAAAPVAAVQAR